MEASIIGTGGNSAGSGWDNTHTGLIDNEGLDGTLADVSSYSKCAVSKKGSERAFLSMKLVGPFKIIRLKLAFRTDGHAYQGKNVMVQVGTTPQYNVNDPVCLTIGQLGGNGLVDYDCNQHHKGQYVILSNDQTYLTICEAKVIIQVG